LNSTEPKASAKEIMGVCNSMGVTVEGLRAKLAIKALNDGKFDSKF